MTFGSAQRLPAILAAFDFSRFERIIDVGGGHGALLAGILAVSQKTRGVVYDLPNVVPGAEALRARISSNPARSSAGTSLSRSLPTVTRTSSVALLTNWDDNAALKILGQCRRPIRSNGRLLLIESVSKPNEPDPNKFLDVWFIGGGGRERTEAEYRALLRTGGFALERVVLTDGPSGILESRPV